MSLLEGASASSCFMFDGSRGLNFTTRWLEEVCDIIHTFMKKGRVSENILQETENEKKRSHFVAKGGHKNVLLGLFDEKNLNQDVLLTIWSPEISDNCQNYQKLEHVEEDSEL